MIKSKVILNTLKNINIIKNIVISIKKILYCSLESKDFVDLFNLLSFNLSEISFSSLVYFMLFHSITKILFSFKTFIKFLLEFLNMILTVHKLLSEIKFFIVHLSFKLENIIIKKFLFFSKNFFSLFKLNLFSLKLGFKHHNFGFKRSNF